MKWLQMFVPYIYAAMMAQWNYAQLKALSQKQFTILGLSHLKVWWVLSPMGLNQ
jgi:hypothetical protein